MTYQGEPTDDYFDTLDALIGRHEATKELRVALIRATERYLNDTLSAAVADEVITDAQASAIATWGAGPDGEARRRRPLYPVVDT